MNAVGLLAIVEWSVEGNNVFVRGGLARGRCDDDEFGVSERQASPETNEPQQEQLRA